MNKAALVSDDHRLRPVSQTEFGEDAVHMCLAAWDLKGNRDVVFVNALLDDLQRRECIDTSRVYATGLSYGGAMVDLLACSTTAGRFAAFAPVSAYLPQRPCHPERPVPIISFHGVEDHLLPYEGGGISAQQAFESWGAGWSKRDGCAGAAVVLYRVHHNGHTWPGHPLGLNHQSLVDYFSGKTTGKPYPLMVVLGLTPEDFADTISLANTDIDASAMILSFFDKYTLGPDRPPH